MNSLLRRCAAVVSMALFALSPVQDAHAQAPSPDPILRIDTIQHQATIHGVAISPDGAVVATTGDDKTIRLWESGTGTLIDTLRIPIGEGSEGVLYSLAFAPSGRSLLAGGVSGLEWDGRNYLYVLRPADRRMAGRLPLGGVLRRVTYSTGSAEPLIGLALSAANGGAIQVRNARAQLQFEDTELDGPPTWIDFAPDGSLIATVTGGGLRVYGPDFSLRAARLTGQEPAIAKVSPDGSMVAIGYYDRRQIDLISLSTLKPVGQLSGKLDGGTPSLNALTWVKNGGRQELWAGGGFADARGRIIIRRWRDVAKPGSYQDLPVAEDTISALEAHPEGGAVFATGDPRWGRIGADFKVTYRIDRPGPDYRLVYDGLFAISPDGTRLAFRYDLAGEIGEMVYDVADQSLTRLDRTALRRVRETFLIAQVPSEMENWRISDAPTIGGRKIDLKPFERSLSVAEWRDGSFVLGADQTLYIFDRGGRKLAEREVSSAAFGVLALPEGRFIAALGDGSLRWYALEEGRIAEKGALYIAREKHRWVAWLPDGRFNHSPNGGQALAGYHLNGSAKELAVWTDFSQLYRTRYDPEAVTAQLLGREPATIVVPTARPTQQTQTTSDPAEQPQEVSAPEIVITEFCPIVDEAPGSCSPASVAMRGLGKIAAAQEGDGDASFENGVRILPPEIDRVLLKYKITEAGLPVEKIDVFRNDKTTGQTRGLGQIQADEGGPKIVEGAREVFLLEGLNTLQLRVYDKRGVYGKSAVLSLRRQTAGREDLPDLHLLAIGANSYQGPFGTLRYARADAETLASLVTGAKPESYRSVEVTELLDTDASRAGVAGALSKIAKKATPDDAVVVYLGGHGFKDEGGSYHFIPPDLESLDQIGWNTVDQTLLIQMLSNLQVENLLLMLDTCYAGAFPANAAGNINNETGFMVLTASTKYEEALDGHDGQNGVFMYALREALDGKMTSPDGVADALALGDYVRKRVRQLAAEKNHSQKPQLLIGNSDAPFPIARIAAAGQN